METPRSELIDGFNRKITYLRVSLTDRCNLRCRYCMPTGVISKLSHEAILSYEQILRITDIAAKLGVTKIRLTGGEPLVRNGVYEFISRLSGTGHFKDISITTNGVLLSQGLEKLKRAGIKRLNISLDTLKREKFRWITGRDEFTNVWNSIHKAKEMGFSPLKINIVVIKDFNDNEILDFAKLSMEYPFHIRFIEYMPISPNKNMDYRPNHVPSFQIKAKIQEMGELIPIPRGPQDGPAERFRLQGAVGEIGFISPMTNHFCSSCNRLRLTAAGRLRPCLLSNFEVDIKTPMDKGCPDEEIARLFMKAVMIKPSAHPAAQAKHASFAGQMSSIGG